jgi:hypothetical protein
VLSICYGALDTSLGISDGFANKLAREFAALESAQQSLPAINRLFFLALTQSLMNKSLLMIKWVWLQKMGDG